ncbi:hypothetical protein EV401DRAFT_1990744, partial [Pisolithus croceorrhizus]
MQRRRKASGWDVHAPGYDSTVFCHAGKTNSPVEFLEPSEPALQVTSIFPVLTVHRFHLFLVSQVYLPYHVTLTCLGNPRGQRTELLQQKVMETSISTGDPGKPVLTVR